MFGLDKDSNLTPAIIAASAAVVTTLIASAVAIINNQPVKPFGCPKDYVEYGLKEREELRYIAQRNNYQLDDWKLILNLKDGKPYNSDQAKDLQVGDRVCLPRGWN